MRVPPQPINSHHATGVRACGIPNKELSTFPWANVIPSGRFVSARARPDGSRRDGMCAADKAL